MIRWLPVLGLCLGVVAAPAADQKPFVAIAGGATAVDGHETVEDPFPLRRLFVPSNQLQASIAAASDGPYVRISRSAFEEKVRAAVRAKAATSPHLVAAKYAVTSTGGRISGTGSWTIAFPAGRPGPVPLDPLRIAIDRATWENGTPAVIYRPTTGPPVLWADPTAGSSVRFDWSARAVEEPGERRFDLRLPIAAIATMDITAPETDAVAVSRTDALVTGPFSGPNDHLRRWRLSFGGQPRVELTVRTGTSTGGLAPAVRAAVESTFDIAPGQTDATFAFDLDPVRGSAAEWLFDTDPRLRVVGVTVRAGGTWEAAASPDGVAPGRVRVRPADPEAVGRVTVRAVAVIPSAGDRWPLPTVRPVHGLPGEETAVIRLHPDLALENLDPGDFLVTDTSVSTDRHYSVSLTGALALESDRPTRAVPTLRIRPAESGVATNETLVWNVRQDKPTLAVTLTINPVRGPVDHLTVRLPNGYVPLSATATPDDPAATWAKAKSSATDWTWEPSRPWVAGKTSTLHLKLVGPPIAPDKGVAFPQLEVLSSRTRSGSFQVDLSPGFDGATTPPVPAGGLSYRGITPAGVLVIRPRPAPEVPSPQHKPNSTRHAVEPLPNAVVTKDGVCYWFTSAEAYLDTPGITYTASGFIEPTQSRSFPLFFPAPLELVSLRVADRWVDDPKRSENTVLVPVPSVPDRPVPFELKLRGPSPEAIGSATWNLSPNLPPIHWSTSPEYRLYPGLNRERTATATGVVRTSRVIAAGLVAALFVLVFCIRYRSRAFGRFFAFILLLMLGGGLVFLPGGWSLVLGPPFAVAAMASALIFSRLVTAGRVAAAAGLAVAVAPAVAQAPDPVTVFLVREDTDELFVYAPQTVLDRLDTLAAGSLPEWVISTAVYSVDETDDGAAVTATYSVYVSRPISRPVLIPLTGIRLTGMTLDGRPAFPTAKADGYAVAIPDVGRHEFVAKFHVPPTRPGADREISFGGPDVPQSLLTFLGQPTSRQPTVPGSRGYQLVAGSNLTAELGGGKIVAVRWRHGPLVTQPKLVVREAAVWDLNRADSTLSTAFLLRTERGGVPELAVRVPSGLEPERATVRSIDLAGNFSTPTGVRNWKIGPEVAGFRTLTLTFANPIENRAVVSIKFVPNCVPSNHPVLRFPQVDDAEAVYGIRCQGISADFPTRGGTEEIPIEAVVREFGKVPELQLDQKPATLALRPLGPEPVALRPTIHPTAGPTEWVQTVQWTVGPRADAEGSVQWSSTGEAPAAVPFDLPVAMNLSDLTGLDVYARTRSGSRVIAWLKKPTKTGSFTWRSSQPVNKGEAELPVPAAAGVVRFLVRPADGWTISVLPSAGVIVEPTKQSEFAVTTGPGVRSVRILVRRSE